VHPFSWGYAKIKGRAKLLAKHHLLDSGPRGAVGLDAFLEDERESVRAFSLAYSNIKCQENWSRGGTGSSIVLLPFTWQWPGCAGSRNFNDGGFILGMRVAQVAPLYESVPPKYYGGTERVVSYLTEELVRQGHDVTLFASGDSETKRGRYRHAGVRCVWINVTRARWPTISLCWNVFSARGRVRHHSFSCRLPAFSAQPQGGGYARDHVTWPAGYS
jgi:hypothetical protein